MIKIALLIFGILLLFFHEHVLTFDTNTQFIAFIIGIILLGVPHGAADLLVASKNADTDNKSFSIYKFFSIYLGRLLLFALTLWFFPVIGNLLFIFFAAYHFGETDLNQFKTNTILGKLFVISYGLIILSVILLHHFDDVKPIYLLFESGKENEALIDWISLHRYQLLSFNGILFFTSTFIYFLRNNNFENNEKGVFLIRFAIIIFILFNLPMLLGFTFYFVVWHSVLSLTTIVNYLKSNNQFSNKKIIQQIMLYSFLALIGTVLCGLTGSMFINNNAIAGYVFLSLAVLTAPHMQIMYSMYNNIRLNSK
jgi:Brp/Blh family beta-carotene 15,15'-monooxygenase